MVRGERRRRWSYAEACGVLAAALRGPVRGEIVARALEAKGTAAALERLRGGLRTHAFATASGRLELGALVRAFDVQARQEGFHVLREWEQGAQRFSREDVPVLMLDHVVREGVDARPPREVLGLLLDYYFLYLLALLVVRAWDEGDPNENLDRITELLADLQGPHGSGHELVEDAAALLFVATSNFQPDESAYHRLLRKVWTLDEPHRTSTALVGAPVIGTHLRWAFTAIYERDLVRTREDNAVDYPWLFFSVVTLMKAYARLREAGAEGAARRRVAEALFDGLTADPWAFVTKPPASLSGYEDEHRGFRELFVRWRDDLLEDLEALLPAAGAYSPLSLQFNFPHNALVASVVLALQGAGAPDLPLNALLRGHPADDPLGTAAERLATRLTAYAAANPERRGDRRILTVAYDPALGLRSATRALTALRRAAADAPESRPA